MAIVDPETGEMTMTDLSILTRPFERSAVEQRAGGGGRVFDYISAETCIRRLNEATGNNWSFRAIPETIQWLDGGQDNNGNSEQVVMAVCELTIPGLGTRQGIGVQRTRIPVRTSEDMLKGVLSDGLKKCATLFGVALELYGPELDVAGFPAPANGARQTPAQIAGVTRGVQATQRPVAAPTRAQQAMEVQRTAPVKATTPLAPAQAYPYGDLFDNGTKMDTINQYLGECGLPNDGNMGHAIKAVNEYGRAVHGQKANIVIGTGGWDDERKQFGIFPKDIGNALAYWVTQEAKRGSMEGVPEMQEAMARDPDPEDDSWDDVPF